MSKKRRRQDSSSTQTTILSVLSVLFFVGIAIGIVVLRAQRRAARNDALFGRNDGGGGGGGGGGGFQNPNPPPFNPQPQPKVLKPGVTDGPATGGFGDIDYREYREDGAILIGFEIGLGAVPDTAVVTYLRPIWQTAKGEQLGTAYGRTKKPVVTVKARPGYAIGGVRIKSGGAIEGLCFTFMRRGEKHLIASDFYISDWYGEPTRKVWDADQPSGDGGFVVGIHGKRFEDKGGTEFHDSGCIGTLGFVLWVRE
ncbi:MAG: hypothetical protein K2V38_22310 [Gemmataceae bacterium]|nr:hypothetical protein [Gemmataceae bacterium]